MSITKVYGGAGCGKTHYLTSEITNLLDVGHHPRSICMITLTRNARDEFVKRIRETTGATKKDMEWFSTMHSVAGKLLGHSGDWITTDDRNRFKAGYHATGSKFMKLDEVNQTRRNCMYPNTEDGIIASIASTGMDLWYNNGTPGGDNIRYSEVIRFGADWMDYMLSIGKYDYTRGIEACLSSLNSSNVDVRFDYLFVDEFQDFSPLQYQLYVALTSHVKHVWICGDDYQSIYRFSGSSPHFLIDTECDNEVILPKTYRFGEAILENSLKYVNGISVKKDRHINPSGDNSHVVSLSGNTWISHALGAEGDVVYLTRSNTHAYEIRKTLEQHGIKTAALSTSGSKTPSVVKLYETIGTLANGDEVTGEDARKLVKALPASIDGKQLLKRGVKTNVETILTSPYYTSSTFAALTLHSRWWDTHVMIESAHGVSHLLHESNTIFPNKVVNQITHFVGTIHKFKGNEADNVFLFTQIPFPFSKQLSSQQGLDEELRTFYVGATRAKKTLFEVEGYLYNGNGSMCENMRNYL